MRGMHQQTAKKNFVCLHPIAAAALAAMAWPASAQLVTASGDVSPSFSSAANVNLGGTRIFIGNTNNGVGGVGTLDVTGGGALTAAQIVPGTGGNGIGTVTVSGPGSIINLTGGGAFNGLDIGSWGTGTMTVANGATVACASPLACPFSSIGNGAGSTGLLNVNGGVLSGFGSFAVGSGNLSPGFGTAGAPTSATLNITNGGSLASTGYNSVANNSGQTGVVTGNVTVSGAGSNWTITRDLASGGGQAFLGVAPAASAVANVTISNGGQLSVTGSRANPAADNSLPGINMSSAAGASSTMTVTSGGSVLINGDTGVFNVGGNSSTNSAGATATLNITNGGTVSGGGPNGLTFMAIGQNQGNGTVNVSGAGSQLTVAGVGGQNTQGLDGVGGLVVVGRNRNNGGGGTGNLNVTNGGSVVISDNGLAAATGSMGLRLGSDANSTGTVNVSGSGSSIVVSSTAGAATTPEVIIGQGGTGKMTVSNGASVAVQGLGQRNFVVGTSSTGSGTLDVLSGSQINASWFAIANDGATGTATIDNATVNLDGVVYFNGNPIGAGVRVGRGVGANGTLNLQNGAVVNIDNSITDASVILGGTTSLPAGAGTLNMSGGSSIHFTGTAANASLQVGGPSGTGFMSMTGSSTVDVGATGSISVGGALGSTGTATFASGSTATANAVNIGGNSDTVGYLGGVGVATVTGAGTELKATGANGFFGIGRGGDGTLNVANQGTVSGITMSVGRNANGDGKLVVDGASLSLSGQQTTGNLSGASLVVGLSGGNGDVKIRNGSTVVIDNTGSNGANLVLGGTSLFPQGSGQLELSGASRIDILAAPGKAALSIGAVGGTGTMSMSGGSTVNVGSGTAGANGAPPVGFQADGAVYVGRMPGASGTLVLNGGSTVNAGFVGVGVSAAGTGKTLGAAGGTGTVDLGQLGAEGTIVAPRFELGAGSLLKGSGTINAGPNGEVVIGGTISPGNSPGRIRIYCDVTMLLGSQLILEIDETGVVPQIDQLVIGNDSTFDITQLQIVFAFIGNTNPGTVDLNLNRFLRASDTDGSNETGLQQAFGQGQTDWWDTVISSDLFAFQSSYYDVTGFKFNPETGQISGIDANAIPEPATYALVLLALGLMVRGQRRAAARR